MDLTSSMLAVNQSSLMSQVQMAAAKKMLDQQKTQGAAAVQMIESAGNVAQAGDPLVAAATGLGGTIDTYG